MIHEHTARLYNATLKYIAQCHLATDPTRPTQEEMEYLRRHPLLDFMDMCLDIQEHNQQMVLAADPHAQVELYTELNDVTIALMYAHLHYEPASIANEAVPVFTGPTRNENEYSVIIMGKLELEETEPMPDDVFAEPCSKCGSVEVGVQKNNTPDDPFGDSFHAYCDNPYCFETGPKSPTLDLAVRQWNEQQESLEFKKSLKEKSDVEKNHQN